MRMRWWSLACLGAILVAATARAEERHLDFLNGLRELRYYDYALIFLDQLDARTDVAPELKEVLPYERAKTLLESAPYERTPEAQLKQLDNATLYLQQFLKQSPEHARAAEANSELAEVLVKKGHVEIIQANVPANLAKKGEFLQRARGFYNEARKMYQAAQDAYTGRLKALPPGYIDPKDPRHAEREAAIVAQIQAEYHLNLCTYHEAQTYEDGDPKRRELLLKAANDFEKLHQVHRSVVAGLYARMHQGKCFEEMGDITKALGIYNELLGHGEEESTPVLKRLQDHVLHFKLICLNHESKNDHMVVNQLGSDWLKANRDRTLRSETGLGIRWELARSLEQLAIRASAQEARPSPGSKTKKKNPEKPEEEEPALFQADIGRPDALYRQAEAHAVYINRYPGKYREPSSAMIKRIRLALGKGTGDPRDFDSAFQMSMELVKQIKPKREAIERAAPAERANLNKAYADYVAEAIRICKLTISLNGPVPADKKDDRENEVNRVRYFLAYAYFSHPSRAYAYDAALIGEYIARKYPNSVAALDAAYLAMAAYQQAYNTSDASKRADQDPLKAVEESKKNFDIERVIAVADYISQTWPTDDKAQDARLNLGDLYLKLRRPEDAAKAFQQVPQGTPQYLPAQMKAGIALWDAAASNSLIPEGQRLPAETVKKYQDDAQKILADAIKQAEAKQPADGKPGDDVTLAKLSLVQILNGTGKYPEAVKLITEGPKSVLVGAGDMSGKRGDTIKVATRTELLRGYVGSKQVEKAREQLKELEKLGGTEGLTGILVNLGKELKKELERLEQAKDPRLNEVLASFEAFLGDLAGRKEGQDYGSLMWVGQTYAALAEGIEKSDPAKSTGYFGKSADAYQDLVRRGESDPKFIPAGAMPGVKLNLIASRRREKRFEEAEKLMQELLETNSNALDIQKEAAQIFQDRAAQGGPDDWKYWEKAISGERTGGRDQKLWGWYLFGEKLRTSLSQRNIPPKQKVEYEALYFEVRYNTAYCRLQFALNQPKDTDKEQQLRYARLDISNTASQVGNFGERAEYNEYNALYKQIQEEYNGLMTKLARLTDLQTVADLPKNTDVIATAPPPELEEPDETTSEETATKTTKKKEKKKEASSGMLEMAIFGLVLVLGAAGIGFMVFRKPQKKRVLAMADDAPLGDIAVPAAPKAAAQPAAKKVAKPKAPTKS